MVSYDALHYFIEHYSKRQTQIQRMRFKKERNELVFRIQSNIFDRAFLQKQLTAKSFIVDIRPGSKYTSDERNKLFSFQIKATLKATTLSISMCSTELLTWKNQKGSNCYPMTFFNGTPPLIFSSKYSIFLDKLFQKTALNH